MAKRVAITFSAGMADKVEPYEAALRELFLEPVQNPQSLDHLDGLLVSGGTDVDPSLYGQERAPETQAAEPERDRLEFNLIRQALERDLPLLCICRGLQIWNVVQGGTLIQHIPDRAHEPDTRPKAADAHIVRISAGTRLSRIVGPGPFAVNSRHHQAADHIGAGLKVTATAPDGIIEALEDPARRFAIAVQWHPEDRVAVSTPDRRIFEAFSAAVNEA